MMGNPDADEVTNFVINNVDIYPSTIVQRTAKEFGVSRQSALKRINSLIDQGDIRAVGKTRGRKYELNTTTVFRETLVIKGLEEDVVYRQKIRGAIGDVPDNIQKICAYGFTEMLNNAIDHSMSKTAIVEVERTPSIVGLVVYDTGIGIFRKIKDAFGLDEERQSLIYLSKGKMTTDKERHSGQGIFFTSRVFDHFSILSGNLYFWHRRNHDDWLTEDKSTYSKGTLVRMRICTCSKTKIKDVFDQYSTPENEYGFARTHVPVRLAQYGDEELVSRSQAKRVLDRFEQFEEVLLDFKQVESIGQAFADEIFRVFRRNNPSIRVHWINDNEQVAAMIQRATDQLIADINQAARKTSS